MPLQMHPWVTGEAHHTTRKQCLIPSTVSQVFHPVATYRGSPQGAMFSHASRALHRSRRGVHSFPGFGPFRTCLASEGGGPAQSQGAIPWISSEEFRGATFEGKNLPVRDDYPVFLCFLNLFLKNFNCS